MTRRGSRSNAWVLAGLFGLAACGGQTVEPLSPRDLTLPAETRRWLADAEDGVIVARARRDAKRLTLRDTQAWRERALDDVHLGSAGGVRPNAVLEALMDARVELAEKELGHAEANVALAESKLVLTNAERAVLHDRATYELPPLRRATDEARGDVAATRAAVRRARQRVEELTTQWWDAYGRYAAAGGDVRPFWIGDAERLEAPATPPPPAAPAPPSTAAPAAAPPPTR